jgi:hypothetical protein
MPLSRRFRLARGDWTADGQLHDVRPRMTPITCAVCHDTMQEPAAQVGTIVVCPYCGSSLHQDDDGSVRRATAAETTELSDADLQTLRRARGRIARPGRRQS